MASKTHAGSNPALCTNLNTMKICLNCKKIFKENYKTQKFCSRSCNASYNNRKRVLSNRTKSKISSGLTRYYENNKIVYEYLCDKCGNKFNSYRKIKKGRKAHCKNCRRITKPADLSNIKSLKELSSRTISKIFDRMALGCSNCGWNECICDLHHIVSKKKGGTDLHSNLTYLCPNCHRMAHNNKISNFVNLEDYIKDSWKKYYLG